MMQIKRKFLNSELQATKIQGIKNSDHKQFFFLILSLCMKCVIANSYGMRKHNRTQLNFRS